MVYHILFYYFFCFCFCLLYYLLAIVKVHIVPLNPQYYPTNYKQRLIHPPLEGSRAGQQGLRQLTLARHKGFVLPASTPLRTAPQKQGNNYLCGENHNQASVRIAEKGPKKRRGARFELESGSLYFNKSEHVPHVALLRPSPLSEKKNWSRSP